ncbi:hypothetical protein J0S82_000859, partial [Galemys pyrenaicus]
MCNGRASGSLRWCHLPSVKNAYKSQGYTKVCVHKSERPNKIKINSPITVEISLNTLQRLGFNLVRTLHLLPLLQLDYLLSLGEEECVIYLFDAYALEKLP